MGLGSRPADLFLAMMRIDYLPLSYVPEARRATGAELGERLRREMHDIFVLVVLCSVCCSFCK